MKRLDNGISIISKRITIAKNGRIVYSIFLIGLFKVSGLKKGLVPDKVVNQGSSAVTKYVDIIVKRMIQKSDKARDKYSKTFAQNIIPLVIKIGGVSVRGVMKPSVGTGLALFDVELLSPKKYRCVSTVYASKYPRQESKLVEENGKATQQAIDKAIELLTKQFNDAKHRRLYTKAYKIVKEVNISLKI
jgi:hypothetical protein